MHESCHSKPATVTHQGGAPPLMTSRFPVRGPAKIHASDRKGTQVGMKRSARRYRSASRVLQRCPIDASSPCRIDSGGTWDIKVFALPYEDIRPVTINMALNLRTRVSLTPFREGWVAISSEGFAIQEEYPIDRLPFEKTYGIFWAAMAHFGLHGLKVHIKSDSPVRSSLGGSSTALIALLKALSKLAATQNKRTLSRPDILHLGYHLEDGVSGGHCGIQDQAAAVYGGVNQWTWCYGNRRKPFQREPLLNRKGQKSLSRHLLVAFSGRTHASGRINRSWVQRFLSGETRSGWLEVNRIVHRLGNAIRSEDWSRAAGLVREEMAVRREITPEALIPITRRLVDQAEKHGCGARFAGAGAGGSLWAVGATDKITRLKADWEKTLASARGAGVLDCEIDPRGVR